MSTPTNPRKRPRYPGARYERCEECGKSWNVSPKAKIPPSGYICPRCRDKIHKIQTTTKGEIHNERNPKNPD